MRVKVPVTCLKKGNARNYKLNILNPTMPLSLVLSCHEISTSPLLHMQITTIVSMSARIVLVAGKKIALVHGQTYGHSHAFQVHLEG